MHAYMCVQRKVNECAFARLIHLTTLSHTNWPRKTGLHFFAQFFIVLPLHLILICIQLMCYFGYRYIFVIDTKYIKFWYSTSVEIGFLIDENRNLTTCHDIVWPIKTDHHEKYRLDVFKLKDLLSSVNFSEKTFVFFFGKYDAFRNVPDFRLAQLNWKKKNLINFWFFREFICFYR